MLMKRMIATQTNISSSKDTIVRERQMKILLSQVTKLNSKRKYYMWCRGYGNNKNPRMDTLLWHITVKSSIPNIRMELVCKPTLGPHSRINVQPSWKISLCQDKGLSSTLIKMIRRKKEGNNYQKILHPSKPV